MGGLSEIAPVDPSLSHGQSSEECRKIWNHYCDTEAGPKMRDPKRHSICSLVVHLFAVGRANSSILGISQKSFSVIPQIKGLTHVGSHNVYFPYVLSEPAPIYLQV